MHDDLIRIFTDAVALCAPDVVVRRSLGTIPDLPLTVVSLGKCAGALVDGIAAERTIARAFVALPAGYPLPRTAGPTIEVAIGSHPEMSSRSFDVGRELLAFMPRTPQDTPVLFLISGGSSACAEAPREPFTAEDVAYVNRTLVASGQPIEAINRVRRHLSAIKNGRLAAMTTAPATTLVYSDVGTDRLVDVGSGPTLSDGSTSSDAAAILRTLHDDRCERIAATLQRQDATPATRNTAVLLADNATLVKTAASLARERGWLTHTLDVQLEAHVDEVAAALIRELARLPPHTLLVAGGEPTVTHQGDGRGGRCSELAVRFARRAVDGGLTGVSALFAGSDGVDGNSGAAGFVVFPDLLQRKEIDPTDWDGALRSSNSAPIAAKIGSAIMIPPTGNNLRDLFLLARG